MAKPQPETISIRPLERLPKRPAKVKCDFCGREVETLWCWATRPFCAAHDPQSRLGWTYDGGRWVTCAGCYPAVDARNISMLVARVQLRNRSVVNVPSEFLSDMYSVVFAAMLDEPPRVWRSGDEFPIPGPELA